MQGRRKLSIGIISEVQIEKRSAWSGTIKYMSQALSNSGARVVEYDPIWEFSNVALGLSSKVVRRIIGVDPMFNRSRLLSKLKSYTVMSRVQNDPVDVIFAPVGSSMIADIPRQVPVLYCSDATLLLMQNYYARYRYVPGKMSRRAIALERAAMIRSNMISFPTRWAAKSAIDDYGIDPRKIMIQPFGANISDAPTREEALRPRQEGPLRLIFCAVEWLRKGGAEVLGAVKILADRKVDARLTIVGCVPPAPEMQDARLQSRVTVVPFIDKSTESGRLRFRELFLEADMLVLPTKAECYGMVLCEAAACGTIPIATRTGGIPEVVQDGATGRLLPQSASALDVADMICEVQGNRRAMEAMKVAARNDFEGRLNWGVWGDAALCQIEQYLAGARS